MSSTPRGAVSRMANTAVVRIWSPYFTRSFRPAAWIRSNGAAGSRGLGIKGRQHARAAYTADTLLLLTLKTSDPLAHLGRTDVQQGDAGAGLASLAAVVSLTDMQVWPHLQQQSA